MQDVTALHRSIRSPSLTRSLWTFAGADSLSVDLPAGHSHEQIPTRTFPPVRTLPVLLPQTAFSRGRSRSRNVRYWPSRNVPGLPAGWLAATAPKDQVERRLGFGSGKDSSARNRPAYS